MSTQKLKLILKNWLNGLISFIVFFLILNIYGKMEHKILHNAPSLDLTLIILFWKKSRKIDHVSWINTELILNLIFPFLSGGKKMKCAKLRGINWLAVKIK